ncbi:unnamed protein product, partial [Soboliphyme baturini]|uniref:Ig-like domain-containing protein n=1 Tax=Soboliphyme baturini TaxID=241478 RepID=A0A183J5C4_9BILA
MFRSGKRFRSGYCVFKKIAVLKPISVTSSGDANNEWSSFDFLLSLPEYEEKGIRCFSSIFLEYKTVFTYLKQVFLAAVIPVGWYIQQKPCNMTPEELVECTAKHGRQKLFGLTAETMERIERRQKTVEKETGEREAVVREETSCPPCHLRKHTEIVVNRTSSVRFKVNRNYLFYCGSEADRQRIRWGKMGGDKIPTCFSRARVYARQNELHIHAIQPEDAGVYWCRKGSAKIASL